MNLGADELDGPEPPTVSRGREDRVLDRAGSYRKQYEGRKKKQYYWEGNVTIVPKSRIVRSSLAALAAGAVSAREPPVAKEWGDAEFATG